MTLPAPTIAGSVEAMRPYPFRVATKHVDTADTATFDLVPVDGHRVEFAPGQFMMLYVFGVGEVPISIAGSIGDPFAITHTIRAVGAVTEAICALEPGDIIGLRGPYGTGWPVDDCEEMDVVVVAGGLGLPPLRPVIRHVLEHRTRYGTFSVIYGARSPKDLLYVDEVRNWRSRFDVHVEVTVDRSAQGWNGDVGLVTNLLPRITFDAANTAVMLCGPEIMMRVVARTMEPLGIRMDNVYVSLERNMKCAIGFCGHCQFGPDFLCKDGPVVPYSRVRGRMRVSEL